MSDEKPPSYPLSDHTRRLRRNLIIVAAIGILLVKFPEITPDKIPALGIDLVPKDGGRNIIIGAVNIICLYLLIFFVWNAMNNYWNWRGDSWRVIRQLYFSKRNMSDEYIRSGRIKQPFSYSPHNLETFEGLYALHARFERISKIKFWREVSIIYFRNFIKVVVHSKTLFAFDLLFPSALAGYSLYLGREHIQFILARIF